MGQFNEFQQITGVFARQGLYAFEPILKRIAVNIEMVRCCAHTAVMVDKTTERIQQIGCILKFADDIGVRGQIS